MGPPKQWFCDECGHGPLTSGIDDNCASCGRRKGRKTSGSGGLTGFTASAAVNKPVSSLGEANAYPEADSLNLSSQKESVTENFKKLQLNEPVSSLDETSISVPSKVFSSFRAPSTRTSEAWPSERLDSKLTFETSSNVSSLAADVPEVTIDAIIQDFAWALANVCTVFPDVLGVSSLLDRLERILAAKLEKYARNLAKLTPKTVLFKSRRNAIKIILRHRSKLAHELVKVHLETEQADEDGTGSKHSNDGVMVEDKRHRTALWVRSIETSECDADPHQPLEDLLEADDSYGSLSKQEYEVVRKYLLDCVQFETLQTDLRNILSHYCTDQMRLVSSEIQKTLDKPDSPLEIELKIEWAVLDFVKSYGDDFQDLTQALSITGNAHEAQMTTVGSYLKQTWPLWPDLLLTTVQSAIFRDFDKRRRIRWFPRVGAIPLFSQKLEDLKSADIETSPSELVEVSIFENEVLVAVRGMPQFVSTITQQLVWLSAACRFAQGGPCYVNTTLKPLSTTGELKKAFNIKSSVTAIDVDEAELCWHALVGDTVIVPGFPIMTRDSGVRGLQASLEIMAALSGVSFAMNAGRGFILKGQEFSLVPVSRNGQDVQWHVFHGRGEDASYSALVGQGIRLDEHDLSSTTAFVGWTLHCLNHAGEL